MPNDLSDKLLDQALDVCAAEPVHIPGIVQPFACLVAIETKTYQIAYASDNCSEFLGKPLSDVLGQDARQVLEPKILHNINNLASQPDFAGRLRPLGVFEINEQSMELSVFESQSHFVLQIERAMDPGLGHADRFEAVTYMLREIETCSDKKSLFDKTVRLLRHMTEFDRVMIYKFDTEFNGKVVAEARPRVMEPYLGLRFPHWDIPAQARAIMAKLPLRFIEDIDQVPVPLRALDANAPPLDITLAPCRGVSTVHMQYLRNMDVASTMTLSIIVDGALWGIISFHHRTPRVPAPQLRQILTSFLGVFCIKLQALHQHEQLQLVSTVDRIKDNLLLQIDDDESMEQAVPRIGPLVQEVMDASGVAVLFESRTTSFGSVPDESVRSRLLAEAQAKPGTAISIENLSERFPELSDALNGCAGAVAAAINPNRALCIFRNEATQSISWAGNPEKLVETVSGQTRLAPRGSFATYLQEVDGRCKPWTERDIYFAKRIWALVNSAERRVLMNTINRQQSLMINELNHRVRNILALVRSVSKQARRRYGSLSSYAKSLEARIQALASAHDIASGSTVAAVSLQKLIEIEMAPFEKESRITLSGEDRFLRADIAPIVSLVIHELTTNAVKYGALSTESGDVAISVSAAEDGVWVHWREAGGPIVKEPEERGFGSTLIEQAVPYELEGSSELNFLPSGVEAKLFMPGKILDKAAQREASHALTHQSLSEGMPVQNSISSIDGVAMLVEDNFIIAKEMQDQLEEIGFNDVKRFSTLDSAMAFLSSTDPVFAVLDVNLGNATTSEPIARHLVEKDIPCIFVTGYGDDGVLAPELRHIPRFTKPVPDLELQDALVSLLPGQ